VKIIYGINGSGLGHATRALSLIQYLLELNHEVTIFTHGTAELFLQTHIPNIPIHITPNFTCNHKNTLRSYCKSSLTMLSPFNKDKKNKLKKLVNTIHPDIIISDDEPSLAITANKLDIPYVSLSFHNYLLGYSPAISTIHNIRMKIVKKITLYRYQKPCLRINASPFIGNQSNTLANIKPLMPKEIENKTWQPQNTHIVVYFNQVLPIDHYVLVAFANKQNYSLSFYGKTPSTWQKNTKYYATSHQEFLHDVLTANMLICTPGSQLACEAACIGIPTIIITPPKQPSQQLTANIFTSSFDNIQKIPATEVSITKLNQLSSKITTSATPIKSGAQTATDLINNILTKNSTETA
jgi:uncharacterized protein (TIGR00661 family)